MPVCQCLRGDLPHMCGGSSANFFPKLTSTLVILDHFSQKKGKNYHFNGLLVTKLKMPVCQCLRGDLPHM